MDPTAFNYKLGRGQGRLAKGEREYVFVLGEANPLNRYHLKAGDKAEVIQETDLTDVKVLRTHLIMMSPDALPPDLVWRVSLIVDGVEHSTITCPPGRTRETTDLAANVSKINGIHQVGIKLQLAEN